MMRPDGVKATVALVVVSLLVLAVSALTGAAPSPDPFRWA